LRETWREANAKLLADLADAPGVTPEQLADLMRSLAQLTTALSAFIAVAETLYPKLRLPRSREFPPTDGGILHSDRGETPH